MVQPYARMDQKASPERGRCNTGYANRISRLRWTCGELSFHVRAHLRSSICEGAAYVNTDPESGG